MMVRVRSQEKGKERGTKRKRDNGPSSYSTGSILKAVSTVAAMTCISHLLLQFFFLSFFLVLYSLQSLSQYQSVSILLKDNRFCVVLINFTLTFTLKFNYVIRNTVQGSIGNIEKLTTECFLYSFAQLNSGAFIAQIYCIKFIVSVHMHQIGLNYSSVTITVRPVNTKTKISVYI